MHKINHHAFKAHRRHNAMQAIKLRFVVESLCEDNGNQSQGSGARQNKTEFHCRQAIMTCAPTPRNHGLRAQPLAHCIASPPVLPAICELRRPGLRNLWNHANTLSRTSARWQKTRDERHTLFDNKQK